MYYSQEDFQEVNEINVYTNSKLSEFFILEFKDETGALACTSSFRDSEAGREY